MTYTQILKAETSGLIILNLHQSTYTKKSYPWTLIEKAVGLYHLSDTFLGEKVVLTPRIPRTPFEDMNGEIIEDTITPRVSLAPTLSKSFVALGREFEFDGFVYGVPNDWEVVIPWHNDRPKSPGNPYGPNPYGPNFTLEYYLDWLKSKKLPRPTKRDLRNLFWHLVPDAKSTKEVWSLKPVPVVLLGQIHRNKFYLADWIVERAKKEQINITKQRPSKITSQVLDLDY